MQNKLFDKSGRRLKRPNLRRVAEIYRAQDGKDPKSKETKIKGSKVLNNHVVYTRYEQVSAELSNSGAYSLLYKNSFLFGSGPC